ncbi:peptide ABC transporter substrate-binding protein [Lihuaxuella thermophila]|nr:peptide ABC transporter substrate-binding protein [Lihuaxuella thermophila]
MKRRVLSLVLSLSLAAGLVGCAGKAASDSASGKLSDQQILRLTIPYPIKTFDHAVVHNSSTLDILSNTGEGLMRLNQNHQPIPGMASRLTISPDQTVYTFTLRRAEWSDGKPVTAHDFEYAWKRILAPGTHSPSAYLFYPIVNAESYHQGEVKEDKVGIRALDDRTLEVRLKRQVRNFLSLAALTPFLPARKDTIQSQGKSYGKDPTRMVYIGPFTISRVTEDGTVILSKNRRYWDEKNVRLEHVYFFVSNHATRQLNWYNADKIDVTSVEREFAEAYKKSPEFHQLQTATTQYIRFNYKNPFFRNKKIRQAISYALNRGIIIDQLKNAAEPAGGLIPPSMKGYKSSFRQEAVMQAPEQDVDKARQLFNEGLAELGLTKPPFRLIMLNYEDNRKELALEIKKQLQENLGLTLMLNTTSRADKLQLENAGKFDLALSDWAATYPDPAAFLETFTSGHLMNTGKYSDAPFDETMKRAFNSVLIDQQIRYLIQAEKFLIQDDQALVPLYYVTDSYLVKSHVKELIRHPFGPRYTLKWVYILESEESDDK